MSQAKTKAVEQAPKQEQEERTVSVSLSLPIGDVEPKSYVTDHIETRLSPRQALGLKRITCGLVATNARFEDGSAVGSSASAVRYMLEQVENDVA